MVKRAASAVLIAAMCLLTACSSSKAPETEKQTQAQTTVETEAKTEVITTEKETVVTSMEVAEEATPGAGTLDENDGADLD